MDPKCTKVFAVANLGDISLADLKAYKAEIEAQQNQDELVLWADATLESAGRTETHSVDGETKLADIYTNPARYA